MNPLNIVSDVDENSFVENLARLRIALAVAER